MKNNIFMLLTNSSNELPDIPPVPCEDDLFKCYHYIKKQQLKILTTPQKRNNIF